MRQFSTGATRNDTANKPDYEGFESPLVIRAYGTFMQSHRNLPDGGVRDSDNWQRGIPLESYMKSAWRHFHEVWSLHRGYTAIDSDGHSIGVVEALCALRFNIQGYLHEVLKAEETETLKENGGK